MKRVVIVGTQWGDEGKGKITDYLAQKVDIVVRYQGGDNAGHTVVFDNKKYSLHLLPSGILNPNIDNVMANGMVINPVSFKDEISKISKYKLHISNRAHIVLPFHITFDGAYEKDNKIGTTNKGIGPTYTEKSARTGLRVATFINEKTFKNYLDTIIPLKNEEAKRFNLPLFDSDYIFETYLPYIELIKPYVEDTSLYLNQKIEEGKTILFEGAQGVMLCLDHGTYPYVTSSSPTAASVPLNTGIAPWLVDGAIGVTKAYTTRVGSGPMPSEIHDELSDKIRIKGNEFGTTTGRPRRIGWLDTVILRHAKRTSGLSSLAVTLLDVLSGIEKLKIVTSYNLDGNEIDYVPAEITEFERCRPNYIELPGWMADITQVKSFDELPENTKNYLNVLSKLIGVEVSIFSVGPDRNQTIEIKSIFNEVSNDSKI